MTSLVSLTTPHNPPIHLDEEPIACFCGRAISNKPMFGVWKSDAHFLLWVDGQLREVTMESDGTLLSVRGAGMGSAGMVVLISSDGGLYHCSVAAAKARLLKPPTEGTTFERVACGRGHCIAVTSDGRVFTWGDGERGQLGLGPEVADDAMRYCHVAQPTELQAASNGAAAAPAVATTG